MKQEKASEETPLPMTGCFRIDAGLLVATGPSQRGLTNDAPFAPHHAQRRKGRESKKIAPPAKSPFSST
jgi:hypothetical protein